MTRLLLLLAVALVLAGCGGGGDTAAPDGTTAAPATTGAAAGDTYTNPVHEENFPDPHVIRAGDTWWAYATNDEDGNVQTLSSPDLVEWEQGPDAMPELPTWAYPGKTWAPEVLALDGKYVLYFTANAADLGKQCVGRAVATKPQGPFVDETKKPLVCQEDEGGTIDASPFRDEDGTLYLLYKNDGNCCGLDTYIYSQKLSPDGLKLVGPAKRLVKQDAPWEGALVEAPTLWKEDGRYYLFFSGNTFDSALYATGYATCDGPLGPCKDAPENPILKSACDASGTGHQTIVEDDAGDTWIVYHAYPGASDQRVLWIDRLEWQSGKPVVKGPTCDPQPAP